MNRRFLEIFVHVIGCIAFLMLPVLFYPNASSSFGFLRLPVFQIDFVTYIFLLIFFYLNYFFLVPSMLMQKRFLWYILSIIGIFLLITYLPGWLIPHEANQWSDDDDDDWKGEGHSEWEKHEWMEHQEWWQTHRFHYFIYRVSRHFPQFLLVLAFSLLLRLFFRLRQTEKEKTNAELSYMKAQMNPHFLFNTLNSIYSLALDRSEDTAPAVVKLSGMMRYVITEASQDHVSLDKEISYINDFIQLQKLRLGNTIRLFYEIKGDVAGKSIAPLILIPFIENAFKYGVNPEEDSEIHINIDITDKQLTLRVKNNKVQTSITRAEKNGLGIWNTSNRLRHLYPGKHSLLITDEGNVFNVKLIVDLL